MKAQSSRVANGRHFAMAFNIAAYLITVLASTFQ
jgi:hypothetical protein